jgi:hypothetical protein
MFFKREAKIGEFGLINKLWKTGKICVGIGFEKYIYHPFHISVCIARYCGKGISQGWCG